MYTGIVQQMLKIKSVDRKPGLMIFSIDFPDDLMAELELGASVSVNGVCFTVTKINGNTVTFDAIAETLRLSNIKYLEEGTLVNIERSAKAGVEVGGHILSGHVVDTASIESVEESENNRRLTFHGSPAWMKYVFNKGFLALNGCSLTVAAVDQEASTFSVNLIPETLGRTNFSLLSTGDEVNVEIDHQTQVIVETVERVMQERYS
jgi:riboflavin synthase